MKISYTEVEENMLRMHTLTLELKKILDDISLEMQKLETNDVWSSLGAEYVKNNYEELKKGFTPIYEELERSILFITDVTDGYKYLDKRIKDEVLKNLDIPTPNYDDSRIFIAKALDKDDNND